MIPNAEVIFSRHPKNKALAFWSSRSPKEPNHQDLKPKLIGGREALRTEAISQASVGGGTRARSSLSGLIGFLMA